MSLVSYEGGHALDAQQLRLALKWFAPAYKRWTTTPSPEAGAK
ncbi:MAG TPA: hypothetical protein VFA77_08245 [Candidatus Eisenbacteria bacterium]|nr:hypothetical protein [Candidatus Eisenbacteria bacterium]